MKQQMTLIKVTDVEHRMIMDFREGMKQYIHDKTASFKKSYHDYRYAHHYKYKNKSFWILSEFYSSDENSIEMVDNKEWEQEYLENIVVNTDYSYLWNK
jgi:hypothetical protein